MYTSFEDSVLDAADEQGNLSKEDALQLVYEHSMDWSEWVKSCPMGTNQRDAEAILSWLGY